jgi:hypothetical protein
MEIKRRNVNELFTDSLYFMRGAGAVEESRNGLVRTSTSPVLLSSCMPTERVLFCRERKENPIFHFMECLWMMAGRRDAKWLTQFNPRMYEYAELNGNIHGAYGFRWRRHFQMDQILTAVKMLRNDSMSRRIVIGMWDPTEDLGIPAKDLPCNTHIYLRNVQGELNMTVCNRSNDLVWGALGSNIVHFSFLLELIASAAKLNIGTLHQFTNNLHIYERHWKFLENPPHYESYLGLGVQPYKLMHNGSLSNWLVDCQEFLSGAREGFSEPFFSEVAVPMITHNFEKIAAADWRLSCLRYLERK